MSSIDRLKDDEHYQETEPWIHTYSNGAKSCVIDKIFTSQREHPTRIKADGSAVPVAVGLPIEITKERLIIGCDSRRSYVKLEVKLFKKHPSSECWRSIECKGYYGISFSPKTAGKISKVLREFSKVEE